MQSVGRFSVNVQKLFYAHMHLYVELAFTKSRLFFYPLRVTRAMLSRFTIIALSLSGIMLRIGLIASLFVFLGQSQASIILKSVGN